MEGVTITWGVEGYKYFPFSEDLPLAETTGEVIHPHTLPPHPIQQSEGNAMGKQTSSSWGIQRGYKSLLQSSPGDQANADLLQGPHLAWLSFSACSCSLCSPSPRSTFLMNHFLKILVSDTASREPT